jgi:hypothetical protein
MKKKDIIIKKKQEIDKREKDSKTKNDRANQFVDEALDQ